MEEGKVILRMITAEDADLLARRIVNQGGVPPVFSDGTVVAELNGEIVAFACPQTVLQVYWYTNETRAGHLGGYKALMAVERVMKANRIGQYQATIGGEARKMAEIAERAGFEDTGERVFVKHLDGVIE
jgi:hypothetical protein